MGRGPWGARGTGTQSEGDSGYACIQAGRAEVARTARQWPSGAGELLCRCGWGWGEGGSIECRRCARAVSVGADKLLFPKFPKHLKSTHTSHR